MARQQFLCIKLADEFCPKELEGILRKEGYLREDEDFCECGEKHECAHVAEGKECRAIDCAQVGAHAAVYIFLNGKGCEGVAASIL